MKLEVLLFIPTLGFCLSQNIVRRNVVFTKIKDISIVNGKWTAATVLNLNPYGTLINLLEQQLETVHLQLNRTIMNEYYNFPTNFTNDPALNVILFKTAARKGQVCDGNQ
jgi:hypothetical protein